MDRLKELILYIAEQSLDDRTFGAIKLNKILFAIDFYAYAAYRRPITEATYIRLEHGPVPRELPDARESLVQKGRAKIQNHVYFGRDQKRVVALDTADMSDFTEVERQLIDDVIYEFKHFNATQLSDWTHRLLPWMLAKDREEIPYFMSFALSQEPVGQDGIEWAEKRLIELGLVDDV